MNPFSKMVIYIYLVCSWQDTMAQNFITRWNLATSGSHPSSLSLNTVTLGTVNYNWQELPPGSATGSGSWSGGGLIITGLPSGSIIRLQIEPNNFKKINFGVGSDNVRLIDVEQWGTTVWSSMYNSYSGCSNLQISATDIPNLTTVTDLSRMFDGCTILNSPSNIGSWNTTAVTNMSLMFNGASAFNQNIGSWNTTAVQIMAAMFNGASAFNQNIGSWTTSAVTDMGGMFSGASAFNQNIGAWSTPLVNNMSYMFKGASAFNQPLGAWITSAVTDMNSMFEGASAFNQNLGTWTLRTAGVTLDNMLDNCGMDCYNYSATLMGWAIPSTPTNRTFFVPGRLYTSAAVTARSYLTGTKNWLILQDARVGGTPVLVIAGQSITASNDCGENTILNPSNITQKIINYNANGNTFTPASVTVDNQGTLTGGGGTFTNSATNYYQSTDGTNTLRVSKRMHSVEAPGSFTANGGVIVRVYYNNAQHTSMTSNTWPGSSPTISSGWYKYAGHTAQSVVNDMTAMQLNNAVPVTPTGSGAESGIPYVEFTVTEFSTFVFVAQGVGVLPVDLLSFTAGCRNHHVVLQWSTATEVNNDYFTLDRSEDGRDWKTIATLKGAGNSSRTQAYVVSDDSPLKGTSYYRLKQTDFDGQVTYFKTISTSCGSNKEFTIKPNPSSSGTFTITGLEQNSDVVIMDALGKIVFQTKLNEGETQIDLSNHVSGFYMVSVSSGQGITSKKIVISK